MLATGETFRRSGIREKLVTPSGFQIVSSACTSARVSGRWQLRQMLAASDQLMGTDRDFIPQYVGGIFPG